MCVALYVYVNQMDFRIETLVIRNLIIRMKFGMKNRPLPFLVFMILISGLPVDALDYDYSYTSECLKNPQKPLYDGGIIRNPEFKSGLKGWTAHGNAKIEKRVSDSGNDFIVARRRHQPHDSFSQECFLDKEKLYTFSAWLRISNGNADIGAVFRTETGHAHAGWVAAKSGCWSMLKGGIVVNVSGPSHLFFESKNVGVEIWVDSISLQPFTLEEWKSHQDQTIEKVRKSNVKIQVVDSQGKSIANRSIKIYQKFANFPLGGCMNANILKSVEYQNYFASRFRYATFGDQMKWYNTERVQGQENYSIPDAMLQFSQSHGIQVRGHTVFWDDPRLQPEWVKSLSSDQLRIAAVRRMKSFMRRYKRKVIAWDVVNENVHNNWYETMLGPDASTKFYKTASHIDPNVPMFLNEFNTIEEPEDVRGTPEKYLARIQEIQTGGYNGQLAIGLQGHFGPNVNLPYVRSAIDKMATANLPIWITELDVRGRENPANQAIILDQVLREVHGHPAVNGIIVWGAWSSYSLMVLTDDNFVNLPTGDVVDKFIGELSHQEGIRGITDADGFFETSLFHGEYHLHFIDDHRQQEYLNSSLAKSFTVSMVDSSSHQHVKIISHV